MWINKKEYELTKRMAEDNEHDANLLRSLIFALKENRIIHHSEFVMMSTEAYEVLFKEACLQKDKYKELEAELEWYKVKYHEMKTNKDTRSIPEICQDCGNYGWDMPQCAECFAENVYKHFTRKYNDNERC